MQTVKVRLRKPGRVLSFLVSDIPLERDEQCVVRTDRGLEFGACVVPPEPCPPELEQRIKMNVIRKMSFHDESAYRQILVEEKKAMDICAQKMRNRNLPMRLVDVEYSMDKRKVVFYFTAEDRVDFRELVRDLAHELKTRIELRHIQVRDAAKMIGGIGTCGRELCCTTWLQDFMPISMKMAKRQNLSLNPTKISGQCGRLMCCISYENEMYTVEKKGARPALIQEPREEDAPSSKPAKPADTGVSAQDIFRLKLEADAATERAKARERERRQKDVPTIVPSAAATVEEPGADDEFDDAEGGDSPESGDTAATQGANADREGQRRPRRRRRGRRNRPGGGQGGNQGGGGQGGGGTPSV